MGKGGGQRDKSSETGQLGDHRSSLVRKGASTHLHCAAHGVEEGQAVVRVVEVQQDLCQHLVCLHARMRVCWMA
jgi:hypothetical protein